MRNLIIGLFFVGSLMAGPVWAQSVPEYGTLNPQGSVEGLDDPQPEECFWHVVNGQELCLTESDMAQVSSHANACDAKADINCLLGKIEDVISLDPDRAMTVTASPKVCQRLDDKKRHPLYGGRYSRVTCVSE